MIKSRRMLWAAFVARIGEMRIVYNILVGKPVGSGNSKIYAQMRR
jgi:hypothetical protein